jgi:hypothetical protein
MTARTIRRLQAAKKTAQALILMVAVSSVGVGVAWAGEEDDIQLQIDTQKTGVSDLERLDELKATTDEIVLLRSWLDEAWALRGKHEYDQCREVLDRSLRQADLIRAKITASKLRAQAQKREAAVQDLHAKIARNRKALQEIQAKKKALEGGPQ